MRPIDLLSDQKEELKVLEIKVELMKKLTAKINSKCWTQEEAAKILKVNQPAISKLMCGSISKLTIDKLVKMATLADIDCNLTFSASDKG